MVILPGNPKVNEEFIKGYESLNEYTDVPGLIELRELLESYRDDDHLRFIGEKALLELAYLGVEYENKSKFFRDAFFAFGALKWIFRLSDMAFSAFLGVYSMIGYSCAYELQRELSDDEKVKIIESSLACKISLGLDNFEDVENWRDVNKKFFKKVAAVKWEKRARKLHNAIHDAYIYNFGCLFRMDNETVAQFALCSRYLASCAAVAKGQTTVSPEGIVNAWFLTFKLLHTDLTSYVFDDDGSVMKKNKHSKNFLNKKGGIFMKKFSKGISIVFSIIFFIVLIIVLFMILALLFGDQLYNVGRLPGLIVLFICAFLTKKFYNSILKDENELD